MVDSKPGALVFNRIIELRDSWAKAIQPGQPAAKAMKGDKTSSTSPQNGKVVSDGSQLAKGSRSEAREQARANNPALASRFTQYVSRLGLSEEDADVLTGDLAVAQFFEAAVAAHNNPKLVANWVTNEVLRELKEKPIAALPFSGTQLGALAALIDNGAITSTIAKDVFAELLHNGGDPHAIVERKGLRQVADPNALAPFIDKIVAANGDKAAQYRSGKTGLLGFFVGQVMKETGGKANPQLVQELVRNKLAA
jgi:glutaminyl-tRNA synthetase